MKKYIINLRNKIHINKPLFIFLIMLIVVGIASGAFFSSVLSNADEKMVSDYLGDFFTNLSNDNLEYKTSITNSLILTLGFGILIWVLGISVIGFILILFMLFIKSFILGFSIGSLIINYKIKGILYALGYVFPHHIVQLLVYLILTAYALCFSFRLIKCITGKKNLEFKGIMSKYLSVLSFSLVILSLCSLYEVYLMPKVMKFIFLLLK